VNFTLQTVSEVEEKRLRRFIIVYCLHKKKCFGKISEFNFTGAIFSRCYIALLTSFSHIKLPCKTNIEPLHAPVIKAEIENAMEIE